MANKIQIRRSTTTAAPTGLANGELAYTANGGVLFIGHPDGTTGSIAIGGLRNPGTLTANQALIANATSAIDKVIVANLVPTQIYANGAVGTAGHVLTSGAAGNVYWTAPTAGVAGSNSQIQFNANGVLSGDDGLTYDGVSNTLTVQNITVNGTATLNIDSISVGSNVTINTSAYFVGNSTVNTFITQNLLDLGGQINANGGVGTAGQVLTSGATGNVYWSSPASGVAGSNSQIQFNANGVLSGDAGFTIDGVTDTLILGGAAATTSPLFRVANSTTSANLSSATLTIGTAVVNASAVAAGSNAYMNTTAVFISTNSTINATMTAAGLQVSNATGTANLTATSLTIGTSVVNSSAFAAGANLIANTSALLVGNSTVNAVLTQSSFDIDGTIAAGNTTLVGFINVSSTANVGGATTLRGTVTVNGALTVANTAALGNTTITGFANVTSTIQGGSSLTIAGAASGITTLAAGNTTLTGFINVSSTANVGGATNLRGDATVNGALTVANTAALGNTTVTGFINVSSTANVGGAVNLRSTLTVNGAITVPNTAALGNTTITGFANVTSTLQVGANVVLGTTTITANASVGTAGQVLTSGATGNVYWTTPTTGTVTSVTGGAGLTGSVSTTGALAVGAGNGITVNADDVAVNANSGLVANSTGVFVNANSGIVANSTGVFVLANTGIIANSTGVFVNPVLSLTDLTLSGNLDINGTLTTVDTTNLSVTDSLISLARGQTTANTLDIGMYGTYGNATVTSYSGLFRDATDGIYKLFAGAIPEPTTTVDTANVNFAYAGLQIGNLTANSLTLTNALAATSGGTGTGTYTSGDLLVANTGNTLSKLSLGTDGKVLQSNGTAVIYADLDGGTF